VRIFTKMASKAFENEFLKGLDLLSKEQQDKVISYVKALLKRTKSNQHSGLLIFAGSLNPKDVQEISSAIEAGCENIDKNEW
jgi:lipopolysaccharide biosynthesis regulator YciM